MSPDPTNTQLASVSWAEVRPGTAECHTLLVV